MAARAITRKAFLKSMTGLAAASFAAGNPEPAAKGPRPNDPSQHPGEKENPAAARSEFSIGNRSISRSFESASGLATTVGLTGRSRWRVASAEFELACRVDSLQWVLTANNTRPGKISVSPSRDRAELTWAGGSPALEIRVTYEVEGNQPRIFKSLQLTNLDHRPVRILCTVLESLEISGGSEPLRGGVGQPVVLKNDLFLGIEHPAASNEARAGSIRISHHPETVLAPGGTWRSQRAVFGAAVGNESVAEAFRRYLIETTGRPAARGLIFNDWGAHDELGTLVKPQLTEQLTFELLDQLEVLKSKYGAQFNDYVLDAFWYDPRGAYLTFKQPNWPHGYEPALRRMQALGMKPGLWFDLGGGTLDLHHTPDWSGPEKPCLADPEFSRLLEGAIEFHVQRHSLALLKFDFANLACPSPGAPQTSLASRERNADALRRVCDAARRANPAMGILAFNTFSSVEMMESTIHFDAAYPVSPWWLLWFDALYSGDPRPSELPSVTSLRDSVIAYQDHVFRGFVRSWLPPGMIDDCGTIVGRTSTIYYLGEEGFTDSWVMNLMRGGHAPTFYGDLRLLSENDRRFLAATMRFVREYAQVLATTRPILGVPGRGEVYGYLARLGDLAFATISNPGLYPQQFRVEPGDTQWEANSGKLIFSNDASAAAGLRSLMGNLEGELFPGEIRIYAIGPEAKIAGISLPPAPSRQFHEFTPFGDPFAEARTADLPILAEQEEMTLAIVIQYRRNGLPDRSFARPQEVMKIEGEIDSRSVAFASIPAEGTDLWSKCSWAVFKHRISRNETGRTLRLKLAGGPPPGTERKIQAMWLR